MPLWHRFIDGNPEYLARHYWFAYLWPKSAWFFDHPMIINAILFGHYRPLVREVLQQIGTNRDGRSLQLSCVYGRLTVLLERRCRELHLADVSNLQLNIARGKTQNVFLARMNAERAAYADNAFSLVLIFFLLHELPKDARDRVLTETVRLARPGGRIVIAEYAPRPTAHLLWRFPPFRKVLTTLEPYLACYWEEDLTTALVRLGKICGKRIHCRATTHFFNGFYCVYTFDIDTTPGDD